MTVGIIIGVCFFLVMDIAIAWSMTRAGRQIPGPDKPGEEEKEEE